MSDVHIGKSFLNKGKGLINVEIFFHVPNTKADNSYPGIDVSLAPGTTGPELTLLQAGTLVEVRQTKLYNLSDGVQTIKDSIRALWQGVATAKQNELDKDYRFYAIELERA